MSTIVRAIRLNEDSYQRIKAVAFDEGRTIGREIQKAIEFYIMNKKKGNEQCKN